MNYEIEAILNIQLGIVERPKSQEGLLSFPRNYDTRYWHIIRVKRLIDSAILCKNFTKTDKGDVLFIKVNNNICTIITSVGEYNINELKVYN